MERKQWIGTPIMHLLFIVVLVLSFTDATAQRISYLNDKAKTYQLRSMENGKWEFHPGLYYVTLHKKYSGGYWKGLNIRWDQNKSDVKQIEPVRASEVILEKTSADGIQAQIDSIAPLAQEESIRSAERIVDMIYPQYEDKFNDALAGIDEMATIINTKSNGALIEDALAIIEDKDLLKAEIEYIHETGLTNQMEQAKRQLAYEDVLTRLQKLYDKSYKLAYFAHTLNNLKK